MNKIKTGLRGLNAEQKLAYAKRLVQGIASQPVLMKNSALYNDLKSAVLGLEKAIEIAAFGDQRAIGARKLCEMRLGELIRKTAAYVNHASEGNEEIIVSAGFEIKQRNNRPAELEVPKEVKAKRTDNNGELVLSWKPVKNSRNYVVQITTKEPKRDTDWSTAIFSTRSKCLLEDLTPGKIYWIRTFAIGAKGSGPPSDIVKIMAA